MIHDFRICGHKYYCVFPMPKATFLLPLFLSLTLCQAYHDFAIYSENRNISSWDKFKYLPSATDKEMLFREYILKEDDPRTYLMCPKGYAIAQIAYAIVLPRDFKDSHNYLHMTRAYVQHFTRFQFPHHNGDRVHLPPEVGVAWEICPTLRRCLLYQACLFNFGNEFCTVDPLPGTRKYLDTNITCVKELHLEHFLQLEEESVNLVLEFQSKKNQVLHIKYKSQLEDTDVSEINLEKTEFKQSVEPESSVFSAFCPSDPYGGAYRGDCYGDISNETVVDLTWRSLARAHSKRCQIIIIETFCAFAYNKYGQCFPPHALDRNAQNNRFDRIRFGTYSFPKAGPRPQKLKTILNAVKSDPHADLIPVQVPANSCTI